MMSAGLRVSGCSTTPMDTCRLLRLYSAYPSMNRCINPRTRAAPAVLPSFTGTRVGLVSKLWYEEAPSFCRGPLRHTMHKHARDAAAGAQAREEGEAARVYRHIVSKQSGPAP